MTQKLINLATELEKELSTFVEGEDAREGLVKLLKDYGHAKDDLTVEQYLNILGVILEDHKAMDQEVRALNNDLDNANARIAELEDQLEQ